MSSSSSTDRIAGNFPVVWDDPSDAERTWRLDRLHHPDPIAPLDFWLFEEVVLNGILEAGRAYGDVQDFRVRRINTYLFVSAIPSSDAPGPEAQRKVIEATITVRSFWEDTIYPEIQDHLRWWASVDLLSLSNEGLLEHLAETVERARRVWVLHFLVTRPTFTSIVELTDLYLDVCGGTDLDAFELIQGFGNKTVEAGRALWRMSRSAAEDPAVRSAVEAGALDTLEGTEWLAGFRDFLDTYGRRSNGFGIAYRSWIEDPSPALDNVRRFMSQPEDPYANLEQLAAAREAAVAAARKRFAEAPEDKRRRFETLLPAAQAAIVITEDHGFYIDFATNYEIRRVFVEAGRRLAEAGALVDPDDVGMLELDEIVEAMRDPSTARLRVLVGTRREEMERFGAVHPPEFLGARRPEGPPSNDPRARFARRFYGPADAGLSDGLLRGAPGAPGTTRGVARLVLDLGSADKLAPGEILVTRTTSPAWTPLFAVAGAVVTDGGGALSHCAIVAREYGIPAVVGTMTGTVAISDGQLIEVDGNEGVVRPINGG